MYWLDLVSHLSFCPVVIFHGSIINSHITFLSFCYSLTIDGQPYHVCCGSTPRNMIGRNKCEAFGAGLLSERRVCAWVRGGLPCRSSHTGTWASGPFCAWIPPPGSLCWPTAAQWPSHPNPSPGWTAGRLEREWESESATRSSWLAITSCLKNVTWLKLSLWWSDITSGSVHLDILCIDETTGWYSPLGRLVVWSN